MSPWTKATPASRKRGSASSLPRRRRLSKAMTDAAGVAANLTAKFDPTNPAPPVIKIRIHPPLPHGLVAGGFNTGQAISPFVLDRPQQRCAARLDRVQGGFRRLPH